MERALLVPGDDPSTEPVVIDLEGSLAELRAVWAVSETTEDIEKTPSDLARLEVLIDRIHPEVVVETGLHFGGSAKWFAERVPQVVTVDIDAESVGNFDGPRNVTVFLGDSVDKAPTIRHMAARFARGKPVMVVLDSDHGTEHVYREACAYARLVTPGSYMVIEDGIYHYLPPGPRWVGNWYDGDPLVASVAFLADHSEFVHDRELEDAYPTTQHPRGWLRRCA